MNNKNIKIAVFILLIVGGFLLFLDHFIEITDNDFFKKTINFTVIPRRYCGNGICEYEIGETPMGCPQDCYVS
jgi:hypothetical protein